MTQKADSAHFLLSGIEAEDMGVYTKDAHMTLLDTHLVLV